MKLDEVIADVSSQLDQQAKLGVQITLRPEVPEVGPTNRGQWHQITNVTAIFADLKRSTELSADHRPKVSAFAYTYFIRAMAVTLERFSADYVDIHGDGIFGLFSGEASEFCAAACAITMKTLVAQQVADKFEEDTSTDWKLTAGVGIDRGTLMVRRLGLRGTKQNEVWAGKPLNMSAKLSSVAGPNQLAVSDRVYAGYDHAGQLRRRALIWSCGCDGGTQGAGLDIPSGETPKLWDQLPAPEDLGLDFENFYRLKSQWCAVHGSEFCEAIVTGKRPAR